jgi:hypothetical protein
MRGLRKFLLAAGVLGALPWTAAQAGWSIGIGFGFPGCYRPYYGYYYRPYPVYVAPPPVIVQPAPVVQVAPVAQPVYASPVAAEPAPASPPPPVVRGVAPASAPRRPEVDSYLQQMNSSDERIRAEAALQLGRLKAHRAVEPLTRALNEDRSPAVRESAARGLGLIGAPAALTALQRAAQADDDRDVRHSASFAAEVIRANLRR